MPHFSNNRVLFMISCIDYFISQQQSVFLFYFWCCDFGSAQLHKVVELKVKVFLGLGLLSSSSLRNPAVFTVSTMTSSSLRCYLVLGYLTSCNRCHSCVAHLIPSAAPHHSTRNTWMLQRQWPQLLVHALPGFLMAARHSNRETPVAPPPPL